MTSQIAAALLLLAGHLPHMTPDYVQKLSQSYFDASILTQQDPISIVALHYHESLFRRRATSSAGAAGISQILPRAWPELVVTSIWSDVYAGAYVLSTFKRCGGFVEKVTAYRHGHCRTPRDVDRKVERTRDRIRRIIERENAELVEVLR